MQATEQVHGKFKVFVGALDDDATPGSLGAQIAAWVAAKGVAAKSIGVEYLEGARQLVLTVGYRDDEPGYPVAVKAVPLGPLGHLDEAGCADLEARMAAAAQGLGHVICHELYITGDHEVAMVFLLQR